MLSDFNLPDYPNPSPNLNQTDTTVFLLIRAIQRVWFYDILFALLIPRRTTAQVAPPKMARRADPGADVWFRSSEINRIHFKQATKLLPEQYPLVNSQKHTLLKTFD